MINHATTWFWFTIIPLRGYGVALREEFAERGIDLFFVGYGHGYEFFVGDFVVGRHERTWGTVMPLAYLTVAENVAQFH